MSSPKKRVKPAPAEDSLPPRKSSRISVMEPVLYKDEKVDLLLFTEPQKKQTLKEKEDAKFREELTSLGVEESALKDVMKIHRKTPDLAPYECKRLFNIKRNDGILKNLNLKAIKSDMKEPRPKRKYAKKDKSVEKPEVILPAKKSSRISKQQPVKYNPDSGSEPDDDDADDMVPYIKR